MASYVQLENNNTFFIIYYNLLLLKRSTDLMLMLSLNETIDQLAMANSVHWYGHVLRREDGNVFKRALYFEVEGQWKKGRLKMTWKKLVEKKV